MTTSSAPKLTSSQLARRGARVGCRRKLFTLGKVQPSSHGVRTVQSSHRVLADQWRLGRNNMATILWIIAVVLVISGIVTLVRGQMLFGILLIVVGLLVGPGGVSIFT